VEVEAVLQARARGEVQRAREQLDGPAVLLDQVQLPACAVEP